MNYLDLFAGAGGLSEGFFQEGFKPIAHVEMDKNACDTLKTRLCFHKLNLLNKEEVYKDYLKGSINRDELHSYLNKDELKSVINKSISKDELKNIFMTIDEILLDKKIDIIIGGPPCQAYSIIGRARDKNNMKGDPRNDLYKYYLKFLKKYQPKVFVFENVPGLLSASKGEYLKKITDGFKKQGYEYDFQKLSSKNFNVLQNRERVIIIGWKKGIKFRYPLILNNQNKVNLMEQIFDDLPDPKTPKNKGVDNKKFYLSKILSYYKKSKSDYLEKTNIRNHVSFTTQHFTRYLNENDFKIYSIAKNQWDYEKRQLDYKELPSELIKHKNVNSFRNRFKVINNNDYCHTIVAHLKNDGHHYIHPNKNQVRSISVREAARIQSFPDNYYFEGGLGPSFQQIGNAVPPLMAKGIAKYIRETLNE